MGEPGARAALGQGLEVERSHEYASRIVEAEITGAPTVINGNVANRGLSTNLPESACVEVPWLVNHNGIQPTRVGELPVQLAAMMQTNINVHQLTLEALVQGKRDLVRQASCSIPTPPSYRWMSSRSWPMP